MWGLYADTYLGGIRDRARHDPETLREFIDNHGVPMVPEGAVGTDAPPRGMNFASPFAAIDPHHQQLVNKIKAYQKLGMEQKETWGGFAGSTRDPARHESA